MKLPITMLSQPDDTTCGPTALHAVLDYYGFSMPLKQVIDEVGRLKDGGTLAVFLGIYALKKGLSACLYNYNLRVFDPTWSGMGRDALIERLKAQIQFKSSKKLKLAILAYIEFLELGGVVKFDDLTPRIIYEPLSKGIPILTGLSATYLYSSKREYTNSHNKSLYDDLRGEPMGHFVVLGGITHSEVFVFDPYTDNPLSNSKNYHVKTHKLINSILLGSLTYDANLLVLERENETR